MAKSSICVFCGASFGNDPRFRVAAATLGSGLAEMGCDLVYGGGAPGLMGIVGTLRERRRLPRALDWG